MMNVRKTILVVLCILPLAIRALPSGAPESACDSMTPQHGDVVPDDPSTATAELSVTDNGDGTFQVELTSNPGETPFKGFFIQIHEEGESSPVGTFSVSDGNVKLRPCYDLDNGVTHVNNDEKEMVVATWEPETSGTFEAVATVVEFRDGDEGRHWVGIQSNVFEV